MAFQREVWISLDSFHSNLVTGEQKKMDGWSNQVMSNSETKPHKFLALEKYMVKYFVRACVPGWVRAINDSSQSSSVLGEPF